MNGWDRFATGGNSTVENGGFTMVRNGADQAQARRHLGPAQRKRLRAAAAATRHGRGGDGVRLFLTARTARRGARSRGTASARRCEHVGLRGGTVGHAAGRAPRASRWRAPRRIPSSPRSVRRPRHLRRPAAAPRRTLRRLRPRRIPTRYSGAAPVTLVHAGKASEQSAMAEVEAPARHGGRGRACRGSRRVAGRHADSRLSRQKPDGTA